MQLWYIYVSDEIFSNSTCWGGDAFPWEGALPRSLSASLHRRDTPSTELQYYFAEGPLQVCTEYTYTRVRMRARARACVGFKEVEMKSKLQDTETRSAACVIAQQHSSGFFIPPVPENHPSLIVCSQQSDGCTRWRSWLRHCATSRKVAGSIPDGVIIFHWHKPSGSTMALGSTKPLTDMSTRNISWRVKAAGAWSWQPNHFHVPIVLKSGNFNLQESSELVQVCVGIVLPLPMHCHSQAGCCLPNRTAYGQK